MGKDPAFLFYHQDFFTGVSDLTNEEVGAYIRCLCIQASKGGISEKHMKIICESHEIHSAIKNKFIFDESTGLYFNERLKEEIEKRKKYAESRANNRKKGNSDKNHMINISKSYDRHMENENENEDKIKGGVIGEEVELNTSDWKPKTQKELNAIYLRFTNETYQNQLFQALEKLGASRDEIKLLTDQFFKEKRLNEELNKPESQIRSHLTNYLKREIPHLLITKKRLTDGKLNQVQTAGKVLDALRKDYESKRTAQD